MEWRDEGILLSVRRHGETSAIIDVFTPEHGRHAGVVKGGTSRKIAPILQPGAQLDLAWGARLEDHIGSYSVEPLRSRAALVMNSRLALAGLNAVTGLLSFCLPEREVHKALYDKAKACSTCWARMTSGRWPICGGNCAYSKRWAMVLI